MKRQKIILTTIAALQTLFLVSIFISLGISNVASEITEFLFPISFFGFALTQLFGTITIYLLYKKPDSKNYLRVFFWLQVVGTAIMCLFIVTGFEALESLASVMFFIIWIVTPFFQAFWCLGYSWKYALEEEVVSEYV